MSKWELAIQKEIKALDPNDIQDLDKLPRVRLSFIIGGCIK